MKRHHQNERTDLVDLLGRIPQGIHRKLLSWHQEQRMMLLLVLHHVHLVHLVLHDVHLVLHDVHLVHLVHHYLVLDVFELDQGASK